MLSVLVFRRPVLSGELEDEGVVEAHRVLELDETDEAVDILGIKGSGTGTGCAGTLAGVGLGGA